MWNRFKKSLFTKLSVFFGLSVITPSFAFECRDGLHWQNEPHNRRPSVVADSQWHTFVDEQSSFRMQLKIYRGFESTRLDHYGAVVIDFPASARIRGVPPRSPNSQSLRREFMITELDVSLRGYRLTLLESNRLRPVAEGRRGRWRNWMDRLIDRSSRDVELEIDVASTSLNLRQRQPVALMVLKWDRLPLSRTYREKMEFLRGFLSEVSRP